MKPSHWIVRAQLPEAGPDLKFGSPVALAYARLDERLPRPQVLARLHQALKTVE